MANSKIDIAGNQIYSINQNRCLIFKHLRFFGICLFEELRVARKCRRVTNIIFSTTNNNIAPDLKKIDETHEIFRACITVTIKIMLIRYAEILAEG